MQTILTITIITEGEQQGEDFITAGKQAYDVMGYVHDVTSSIPSMYDTGITVVSSEAVNEEGTIDLIEDLAPYEESQV